MGVIADHPLYKKLQSLNLPTDDYAVFGSGPVFAHGLIDKVGDIDLVARGKAWIMANEVGEKAEPVFGSGHSVKIFGGEIEVHNAWSPGNLNVNDLIDNAKIVEGIRFVDLETVLKWKKLLGREKDKSHIEKIEEYLGK
jgi:hypothetical protein